MMRYWLLTLFCLVLVRPSAAQPWRAGVARVDITPQQPMWMSGYAARDRPADGTRRRLYAKALALQDADSNRGVLITLDLVGIDRAVSVEITRQLRKEYQLPRSAFALCTSHTHSGPVVGRNLTLAYVLDEPRLRQADEYAERLVQNVVALVGDALDALAPAELSWSQGVATFAVNRRNNAEANVTQLRAQNRLVGPVDHDVPVLAVRELHGELVAIATGYACHATVLDDYLWSGDWPGAAQDAIEARHPGAMALYWAGCGADQNPLPRRKADLLDVYGNALADAVDQALAKPLGTIAPHLQTGYRELALPLGKHPTLSELRDLTTGSDARARWARQLMEEWERDGELAATYPYPLQRWRLGDVDWLFLGGETVVDYALRIKHEYAGRPVWVTSYANDVMGYIPSRRVLMEGGYEGGESRIYYGLPAPWDGSVERVIMHAVRQIMGDRP